MNYEKHYSDLIQHYGYTSRPQDGGYYERHHIVPKSMGGSNEDSNQVYLTARCHLLAHWLLMRQYNNMQMRVAYSTMCSRGSIRLTPKMYEIAREAVMGENSAVARRVHTPLGWFGSVREAARAHGTSSSRISDRARGSKFWNKEYYYEDTQNDVKEEDHGLKGKGKRIHTPLGWFGSVREASRALGIYHSTISRNCKNKIEGYFYEDECYVPTKKVIRRVHTPLGWFDTVSAAAKAMGVGGAGTISSRCKAGWPDYYYSEQV